MDVRPHTDPARSAGGPNGTDGDRERDRARRRIVGVVVGGSAPGTARNPITFGVVTPRGSVYVPLTPNRVLDSRINLGITGKIHNQVAATFQVTGLHPADVATNVPADAVGITGNLTVTQQSVLGYLSLTPSPQQSNDLDPQLPGR